MLMAEDRNEMASLQLTINQLRKVAVSAQNLHKLNPMQILIFATANELKSEMSFDEATAIMHTAWSELERVK